MFDSQFQTAPTDGSELRPFVSPTAAPHRPNRVKHMPGRQTSCSGHDSAAGWTAVGIPPACFLHQFLTGSPMNRAVHSPSTGKPGIGRVHNRIDLLICDVSLRQFQTAGTELHSH